MGRRSGRIATLSSAGTKVLDIDEERQLAARLAGVLFLTAAVTGVALLMLPGIEDRHWPWVVGICAGCAVWGAACLAVAKHPPRAAAFWLLPAAGALAAAAGTMAATGGADSPARFYLFFTLVYVAYFYPARHAWPYLAGCVIVAALPLAYDSSAVGDGYIGELIILGPAYLLLGALIIKGKAILVTLREQARAQALRDPLTELPNRRALVEWLDRRMRTRRPTGLLLVDLDGFKEVNSLHGYPEGDRVLCEAGAALRECVRADDFVARLGGDEFAVLTPDAEPDAMRSLADRVLECLRGFERSAGLDGVRLTASAGWALYPADAETLDDLVASADVCLRGAKVGGRDRVVSLR
jgi:diguanylate cyclase (GGDEF)-like protein